MAISNSKAKVPLIVAVIFGATLMVRPLVPEPNTGPEVLSRPQYGMPVNNGYPALSKSPNGDVWMVWTSRRERDPRKKGDAADLVPADHIMLKRRNAGGWSKEIEVSVDHIQNSDPTVAADAQEAQVIWSRRRTPPAGTVASELFARRIGADLALARPVQLTNTAAPNASPTAAVAPGGSTWLVWESFEKGHNGIYGMRSQSDTWTSPELLSGETGNAYRPALTISKEGVVSVVWDGRGDDRYGAFLRQFRGDRWDEIRRVPSPPGLDAYAPKAAATHGASVWIAYAQNPERTAEWGLTGWKPMPMPRPSVRAVLWDGQTWQAAPAKDPGFIATNADMPNLVVSENGGVKVIMLRLKSHLNFRLWSSELSESGWEEPRQLDVDEEEYQNILIPGAPRARMDQRPALIFAGDRILMAYERGTGWAQNRQIAIRELDAPAATPAIRLRNLAGESPAPSEQPIPRTPQSGDYQAYFGDIHTHLLMDDGWTGTADQFYAFARDRRQLDFAAYTPHAESNKLIGSEIAMVHRIAAGFNQPGRFVGIPGWEWTQGDFKIPQEGHKHILNETDDQPFFSSTETVSDSAKELTALMRGTSGIMFAHHVSRGGTGGTNFDVIDPAVEPDMEIASHWGRFEFFGNPGHTKDEIRGCSVQDAWRKGIRVGLVGGSDNHDLFMERGSALTAVLAKTLDRRAIFDALRNRRCYATTGEKIRLDVRVNGALMGSVIRAGAAPVIAVRVTGTNTLEKVEVVKFWKGAPNPFPTVYAVTPGGPSAAFEWKDLEFSRDSSYYVRVTQRADPRITSKNAFGSATGFPNEMAWSSPVWVEKK